MSGKPFKWRTVAMVDIYTDTKRTRPLDLIQRGPRTFEWRSGSYAYWPAPRFRSVEDALTWAHENLPVVE